MGQFYEVQFAKQLDGSDQFGNVTYSVKFTTESESVLWRVQPKNEVTPGQKVFGRIEEKVGQSGKPYRMFKREQQDQGAAAPTPFQPSRPQGGAKSDDRSDGMRQGMCINNAVNYVTAKFDTLNEADFIRNVERYARALYTIDLAKESTPEVTDNDLKDAENGTLLQDIDNLFGATADTRSMEP